MKRRLITMLAGLALLAQSTAIAWAAPGLAAPDEPAAAAEPVPCHGDDTASTDGRAAPCDCCDGTCSFACGGAPLPTPMAGVAVDPPDHAFVAPPILATRASHPLSPFRPPAA